MFSVSARLDSKCDTKMGAKRACCTEPVKNPTCTTGLVAADCQSRSSLLNRISLLPRGETCVQPAEDRNWLYQSSCTQIAASREVLPGRTYRSRRLRSCTNDPPNASRLTGDFGIDFRNPFSFGHKLSSQSALRHFL